MLKISHMILSIASIKGKAFACWLAGMHTLKLLFNALFLETFIPVRFFVVGARQCRSYRA